MNKRTMKKGLAIVLALVMVFAMTATAFASTDNPSVKVSVTANNFSSSGEYTGTGFTNLVVPIANYQVDIANVDYYIADKTSFDLKSVYLPSSVTDPMGGSASVADAIIATIWENYGKYLDEEQTSPSVVGGWDSITSPNGGYISNIMNYTLQSNATTYFRGENGNKWGRSTGTGWNVAYKYADGSFQKAAQYTSNIPLVDGMEIIFDVSPYDMTWDTNTPWTEN